MHPSAQRLPTMYASPPKVFSQYILVCNQCIIYSCVCPSKVLFQSYRDSLPKQKKHVKLNLHHGSSDLRRGTPFPVVARFSAGLPPKALTCKKGMWIIPTYLRSQSFLLSFHIFPISSHPHSSCVFHLLTSHYKNLLRCCVIYNIYTYNYIFIYTTCRLFCKLNLGCILPWFMCKVRTSRRTAKRWGSRFPAQLVGPPSHRNQCILYMLFWVNILDS